MRPATAALAVLLFLLAWPLALYPALLVALRKLRGGQNEPVAPEPEAWPDSALIICALNEQNVIGRKLENSLELDYPGKLHIVVVNDGSTDGTAEIVRGYASRGVDLIHREKRRGKVANLNDVIQQRNEPVIVLSDANVFYDPKAVRHLVARLLSDPRIGCVTGKVRLVNTAEELRVGEEGYYSLEWLMQEEASRLWSMVGADGAMYAFRRELFRVCPADTIIEDLVMPVGIVRQGFRVVMEPGATAVEEGPQGEREEFRRKIRIASGAAQGLKRGNAWPGEKAPAVFWFIWASHKLLRWMTPVTALLCVVLAALAWPNPLAQLVLAGVSAIALLAAVRKTTGWSTPLLNVPYYFLFGQIAVLIGLWRGVRGSQSVLWAKANR
jgi:cellulose synthase/poly-beta-1,6-N-acetylglucosamine synthase-like glycosyltransferase